MIKRIWILLLKLPLVLLVIISFFASIYVAFKGTYGITFATPVILGIILILYIIGIVLETKKRSSRF